MSGDHRDDVDGDVRAQIDRIERQLRLLDKRLASLEARTIGSEEKPVSLAQAESVNVVPTIPQFEVPLTSDLAQPLVAPVLESEPAIVPLERLEPEPALAMQEQFAAAAGSIEGQRIEPVQSPIAARKSFSDVEQRLTGRVLAWMGGLALLFGALFFLSLAFSRGWIGPGMRVTIGLVAGAALVATGAWLFERRDRLFGHVLTPVGLSILSLSFMGGTRLYGLIPIEIGLAGALLSAIVAAFIAIRANSQLVAAYGLIAALVAPILYGASPNTATIAFLSVALIGTTAVALYRTWSWLPAIAFLLAAPQLIDFVTGDVSIAAGMIALSAFWLLNAVAAGGEEFRVQRGRLGVTSTTLLVANAVFIVANGFYLLQGDAEWGRGLFLVILAAAHFALGGYFLVVRGDHHPFGMLAFGTGVACATMAIPVQLGGPPVPIGWAAEAAALAWVYAKRRHGYSGLMSIALAALAIGHLVRFEYPLSHIADALTSTVPFVNANGGTLAFLLGALAVAIYFVETRGIRALLTSVGALLIIYALPFETSGLLLVALWSILSVLAIGVHQRLFMSGARKLTWADSRPADLLERIVFAPAALAMFLSALHVLGFELPLNQIDSATLPATPFWDRGTAAALILMGAVLVVGYFLGISWLRRISIAASIAAAAYLMPFELHRPAVVVAWSALALVALAIRYADRTGGRLYAATAWTLLSLGTLLVLVSVAPPNRLFVDGASTVNHPLFWSGATAAIGAISVALLIGAWLFRSSSISRWLFVAGVASVVYLLSIGVVDEFQGRLGGATALEELQKQAQVALSILWAVLGGLGVIAGLGREKPALRGAGLALLGLVTAKVFVYDLASLDTAYRVLSFIGLGVLLLISAYLYQHIGPHPEQQERI